MLGLATLLTVQPKLVVDGMPLTQEDIQYLLSQTNGLAMLKGKWVEVDHDRLQRLLEQMEELGGEETLFEALRKGLHAGNDTQQADVGSLVTNGKWLSQLLHKLRTPSAIRSAALPGSFQAELRPYQKNGYTWLDYMSKIGFGACLADDMGLGKTVQVLAYLEKMRTSSKKARVLLVVPASLLGNWKKEAAKFAPLMEVHILHGRGAAALGRECKENKAFLTITTYGMAARIKELTEVTWDAIILDEAQAIKNPLTKQTQEIKKLKGNMRIAMTGTPIENDLTNLWSLFDFLNKGLLGSSLEFYEFCKNLSEKPEGYARLKAMIAPFMLRRLKSDKKIISDLPEKVEMADYLTSIFHRKGYVLHGSTPIEQRNQMVEAFQGEKYVPFMVLSVRAGGTGLNLTNANHVIHFDRWWNPAVENQATDRAYRIGQKKSVMVHKLVSSGTIEEKIDELLRSKKELAENVIGSGGENWITEMSNEELLSVLSLGGEA